jgi:programmed cell death 6-interacting protein
MFRHDLDVIDSLRRDAVNSRDAHPSGIKKLQAYAGQLVWMSGKFPIDVRAPAVSVLTSSQRAG